MQDDTFLINAIFGVLDIGRVRNHSDLAADEKTLELIRRFQEIHAEFPAAQLDKMGVIPEAAMKRLKQIGFFGLNIPAAYGGMGLSLQRYLRVTEEIVALNISLGFTSLAHLSIGTKGILLFGTEAQKEKYLKPAASGEMIFSYALTEPRHGSDAKSIETTAVLSPDGRHYILNGQKSYITNFSARLHGGFYRRNRLAGCHHRQGYAQNGSESQLHRHHSVQKRARAARKSSGKAGRRVQDRHDDPQSWTDCIRGRVRRNDQAVT